MTWNSREAAGIVFFNRMQCQNFGVIHAKIAPAYPISACRAAVQKPAQLFLGKRSNLICCEEHVSWTRHYINDVIATRHWQARFQPNSAG